MLGARRLGLVLDARRLDLVLGASSGAIKRCRTVAGWRAALLARCRAACVIPSFRRLVWAAQARVQSAAVVIRAASRRRRRGSRAGAAAAAGALYSQWRLRK